MFSGRTEQIWIDIDQGRMLAQRWIPPGDAGSASLAPIILLHDSLGCIALWRSFPALLASSTGRCVIACDRLGFGQSSARTDSLSHGFIEDESRYTIPLLQRAFGFEHFVVFGHSVGGGMAVYCAARHPGCVALITESAQAYVEERTREGIRAAQIQFRDPEALARLARYHGTKAGWVLQAWIGTWLSDGFADWSLRAILPQVHCPTLVIHGSDDEYGSRAQPEMIAALAGGPVQLEILEGVGHIPHREQASQVAGLVVKFLAAITAPSLDAGRAA